MKIRGLTRLHLNELFPSTLSPALQMKLVLLDQQFEISSATLKMTFIEYESNALP